MIYQVAMPFMKSPWSEFDACLRELRRSDPRATLVADHVRRKLRLEAHLDVNGLLQVLARSGLAVPRHHVRVTPPTSLCRCGCDGDCGGHE